MQAEKRFCRRKFAKICCKALSENYIIELADLFYYLDRDVGRGNVFPDPVWWQDSGVSTKKKKTTMDKQQKQAIIDQFKRTEGDVGSVEVQVAILTARIKELTEHMKLNKKDFSSRKGLVGMVNQRRSLLRYLSRNDFARYSELIAKLGLRR